MSFFIHPCYELFFQCFSFVAEEWGPCSVICGVGVRMRKVVCKAHLDYTGVTRKFTDDTCTEKKPKEEEPCIMIPCVGTRYTQAIHKQNNQN